MRTRPPIRATMKVRLRFQRSTSASAGRPRIRYGTQRGGEPSLRRRASEGKEQQGKGEVADLRADCGDRLAAPREQIIAVAPQGWPVLALLKGSSRERHLRLSGLAGCTRNVTESSMASGGCACNTNVLSRFYCGMYRPLPPLSCLPATTVPIMRPCGMYLWVQIHDSCGVSP